MTKKPSYRFTGYTEVWEEKKLGNLGSVEMCRRIFKEETSAEFEIPFFKIGTFGGEADTYITREKFEEYKTKFAYPQRGDLLLSASGSIGRVVEYDGDEAYYQDSNIVWLNHHGKINNKFLKAFYKIVSWSGIEGTTIKRLYNKNILETDISLPSLSEQTAIGSFFQDIDQLISLQQRKLEVLKEQKKTYLKLLFSAKGQTKPALRFAGFEDDWKEVKLGDLILRGGSGGTPKSTVAKYYGGDIPFLSITDISNSGKYLKRTEKTITNEGLQNSSAWVVPEGAISLAMYASVGKLAILGIDCATSQAFYNMVFEDDIVRNFVYITLEKANIYNEWGSLISTGTQANLNAEKVKNFSFLHPSKPEQEVIGSFFQDLDKAIAKQEEKVNQLKESKQTLLRKMFI
ncbi:MULTISPECIES: restriction endonuclease subunit S [Streptococcus]|uniref:restriction endonuclease subunit S n=1 Tax=Streptococcus TaxID=1301 RepID=UPI00110C2613|nr:MULTISPECIES: restriction endonuclease subunit S [Streptococcus]MBW8144487.1 restriction endonuclease subunit S [Streptococcus pseudopneumoniae]MCE2618734.1 restriction endonuclease subunit S [Streptococcus pseudopneumoniae]TMR64688.1 restriction endonuclease subunit S [Streptococcus pseudopneumoniae]